MTVRGPGLQTGLLLQGQSESVTLDQAGSFESACALYPAMKRRRDVTR